SLQADACVPVSVVATPSSGAAGNFTLHFPSSPCGLPIKLSAPPPPDVKTSGAVTYVHSPWGTRDSQGLPSWTVVGASGSESQPGYVLVFADLGDALLGATAASPEAPWGPANVAPQGESVLVALADLAGNASVPARVRDVEAVVTLGRPEGSAGSKSQF